MSRLIPLLLIFALVFSLACTKVPLASKQSVRFPLIQDPTTLDAAVAQDEPAQLVLAQLQHSLTKRDNYGKVLPGLAERWEISPDGKKYTFHLRSAKWSDGVEVQANDFVAGWQRLLDPKLKSAFGWRLYPVENAEKYAKGEITDPALVGVHASEPKKLEVTLSQPNPAFLEMISYPCASPVRQDVLQAHSTDFAEPLQLRTTGPYVVLEWQRGTKLTLATNTYYYGRKPGFEKVEFWIVRDPTSALAMYDRGELDILYPLPPGEMSRLIQLPEHMSVAIQAKLSSAQGLVKQPGLEKIELLVKPHLDNFRMDVFGVPCFAEMRFIAPSLVAP